MALPARAAMGLTPFERAAVAYVDARVRGVAGLPVQRTVRRLLDVVLGGGSWSMRCDRWELVVRDALRLDGEVARTACITTLLDWLPAVEVYGLAPNQDHVLPRVLAHTTVGACDSWWAELADGRVAVAVRTPAGSLVEVTDRCRATFCRRGRVAGRLGPACTSCNGSGREKRLRPRPGRWYRAAFPVDATARALLDEALRMAGPDGDAMVQEVIQRTAGDSEKVRAAELERRAPWAVLLDRLLETGALSCACAGKHGRRCAVGGWPKPDEWPMRWRTVVQEIAQSSHING